MVAVMRVKRCAKHLVTGHDLVDRAFERGGVQIAVDARDAQQVVLRTASHVSLHGRLPAAKRPRLFVEGGHSLFIEPRSTFGSFTDRS
jgi:hypothetical protein